MTRTPLTPDRLTRALDELSRADTAALMADVFTAAKRTRQRRWTAPMWWLPQPGPIGPAVSRIPLAIGVGLLLVLLAFAVFVAGALRHEPARPYLGVVESRPPLLLARSGYVAVSLGDGRVLVAAGEIHDGGGSETTMSAEVYDPTDGSSTRVADVPLDARHGARLSDGRVLLIGAPTVADFSGEGELFDPSARTFSTLPALQLSDETSAVFAVDNDNVLIVGFGTSGIQVFDVRRGILSDRLPMPSRLRLNADIGWLGTKLTDGRVLLAPETGGPMVLVDPQLKRMQLTRPEAPAGPCLAGLADGSAVILGVAGLNPPSSTLPIGRIYDPGTDTARDAAVTAGVPSKCIALRDGRVLVVAGPDDRGSRVGPPTVFDPLLDAYVPTKGDTAAGGFRQVVALENGDVLLLDGRTDAASQAPGTLVGLFK